MIFHSYVNVYQRIPEGNHHLITIFAAWITFNHHFGGCYPHDIPWYPHDIPWYPIKTTTSRGRMKRLLHLQASWGGQGLHTQLSLPENEHSICINYSYGKYGPFIDDVNRFFFYHCDFHSELWHAPPSTAVLQSFKASNEQRKKKTWFRDEKWRFMVIYNGDWTKPM